jgi:hypothetical protein
VTSTTVLVLALSPVEEHGEHSSAIQLADVLGGVMGVAAATAIFAALHSAAGQDRGVFTLIFVVLTASAAVAVPAGLRIRT